MFMGVRAYSDALSVESYETAQAALERAMLTPTGKRRAEKPYGFHLGANNNHGVTWVRRMEEDGAIAFRLYNTDVVVWYPDNSIDITNFGSVTTSAFARQFLPAGIYLRHPTEMRGHLGGDRGVVYAPTTDALWYDWRICAGDTVRFQPAGGAWVPDEDTCDQIHLPELTGGTRAAAKRYNLRDFELWLPAAAASIRIEHDCWDVTECADALERRDFRTAATFLPLITVGKGFGIRERIKPLPVVTTCRDQVVTMSSFRKLRIALCELDGQLTTMSCATVERKVFEKRMALVRELRSLDIPADRYGISR